MLDVVAPDSIGRRADLPSLAFECSSTDGSVGAAWVHVAGELDIAAAPQLSRALRESQVRSRLVVLDLRELSFMDSSGVHAIVDASICAREAGRRLVVLRGPPNVDRMFVLTGTSEVVKTGEVSSFLALIEDEPV
jgi:anti-sigma B factor antagonist